MDKTIVVTGIGGPAGIALGQQLAELRAAGSQLICVGTDIVEVDDPNFDMTVVVPRADDLAMVPALRHLVGQVRADLLIPTVADEIPQMAVARGLICHPPEHQSDLDVSLNGPVTCDPGSRSLVVVSDARAAAISSDKLLTMWALEGAGLSVPKYAQPNRFQNTEMAMTHMGGALIVKPRVSRGGRGVQLVTEPDQLDWSTLDGSWLVQSFAAGVEYCPQVYRSAVDGSVDVVVLEKTILKGGAIGNAVSVRRLGDDEARDVAFLAVRTAQRLNLVGPIDMDIRRDEFGVPQVLEVNPRFGANSRHAPELLRRVFDEYL